MKYGYKVCYREQGKKGYVRHFKTYTRRQAACALIGFLRYPPLSRDDGHILLKPKWKIIAVKRKENSARIWNETPF